LDIWSWVACKGYREDALLFKPQDRAVVRSAGSPSVCIGASGPRTSKVAFGSAGVSKMPSQGSLVLPLCQHLIDLQDFRYVFTRFEERRNLPRTSVHRVFARIEGGERETHVLAKSID
jgi:hypothetical protein